jgi:hypothetical protein
MKHTGVTIFLVLLLQGCGFAHVRTNVPSSGLERYSYATVGKISVTSLEQNADLQGLNRELETDVASRCFREPACAEPRQKTARRDPYLLTSMWISSTETVGYVTYPAVLAAQEEAG